MTRIVFAGTPEFARESLRALVVANLRPVLVLTQPDRPAGRGRKLMPGPVKLYAQSEGLPLLQPVTLRDQSVVEALRNVQPDVLVVAAYGLLLPQSVLDIPAISCVNVHASLLPRWRGAAPIQAAILAGDQQTGISLMKMEAGLDTGPVYCMEAIDIGEQETAGELHDRLATLGGRLLADNFHAICSGRMHPVPQDDSAATYAGKISTAAAEIDWSRPAAVLARHVRAFNPTPGAWTTIGTERLKCWRAIPLEDVRGDAGQVVAAGAGGVVVACGEGGLRLEELQRSGRARVSAAEFSAQRDLVGRLLGPA